MSDLNAHRFQDRPNSDDLPEQWKILRAPKKGTPRCIILDADVCGCYVHYWSGRTRPCKKVGCEICDKGQVPRWRGYLAVLTPAPSEKRLLEITPSVIVAIDRWKKQEGTLRGSIIRLTRKGNVQNGELVVEIGKQAGFDVTLPPCPNVLDILGRIWRITHAPMASEAAADAEIFHRKRFNGRMEAERNGHAGKP